MPKTTSRLHRRFGREDAMRPEKLISAHGSEEITTGAIIVAAMFQAGKLPVPNQRNDDAFEHIAELVAKCAKAISKERDKPIPKGKPGALRGG
jgi:ArsR family metal-binding transcriptional regulator